jgi:hypothetical protein
LYQLTDARILRMTESTLDKDRRGLLGVLVFAAAHRLASETLAVDAEGNSRNWRLARVLDLVIVDQPADETAPRSINVYFIEDVRGPFRIAPDRLLFALRWLHKGEPPDLNLMLAPPFKRAVEIWFTHVTSLLLGAIQQADDALFDRIADATRT